MTRTLTAVVLVVSAGPAAAQQAGYAFSVVAPFTDATGTSPSGGLAVDPSGTLYGTTTTGGANGFGTVFRVTGGAATPVASFAGDDGAAPVGGVVRDGAGNLYGTANVGGAGGLGAVFKVAAGTGAVSTLASFDGSAGAFPLGGLVRDGAGNLYGTTNVGLDGTYGTVFRVAADGTFSTLHGFAGDADGANPQGGLVRDAAGNLYGTTSASTTAGASGTVFKIDAGTGAFRTLATFTGANGSTPLGGLVADAAGNLFGTTSTGGANGLGTVFEIAAETGNLTTLATFTGANGTAPSAGLTLDAAGNLYGTTRYGGANDLGTVFKVAAGGGELNTLYAFAGGSTGANPQDGLALGTDGVTLFGTTRFDGSSNLGIVYALTPTPEPAMVFGVAAAALGVAARRRRRS